MESELELKISEADLARMQQAVDEALSLSEDEQTESGDEEPEHVKSA